MRIESVRLTPSFTTIRLCYELPAGAEVVSSDQWAPEITVRVGDGEPVGEASVPSDYATDRTGLRCADIGFAVAYEHGPATLVVSVQRLSTELPAVISEDLALAAARNLNNEGIEVQFLEIGRGVEWDVLRKPAGMSEEVAYELIVNALRKHIEGPWVFQVGISH